MRREQTNQIRFYGGVACLPSCATPPCSNSPPRSPGASISPRLPSFANRRRSSAPRNITSFTAIIRGCTKTRTIRAPVWSGSRPTWSAHRSAMSAAAPARCCATSARIASPLVRLVARSRRAERAIGQNIEFVSGWRGFAVRRWQLRPVICTHVLENILNYRRASRNAPHHTPRGSCRAARARKHLRLQSASEFLPL